MCSMISMDCVSARFILTSLSSAHICCKCINIAATWSKYIISMSLSVCIDCCSSCQIVIFMISPLVCVAMIFSACCNVVILIPLSCSRTLCHSHVHQCYICASGVPWWHPSITILLLHSLHSLNCSPLNLWFHCFNISIISA